MHPLKPPKFSAKVVYSACISRIKDQKLKKKLLAIIGDVAKFDTRYRAAGRKAILYKLLPHDGVGEVTRDQMIKVYTYRMAKKEAAGRFYYDELMASPAQGRCPLCGQGTVTTLDHHLPKTEFPLLVVTPYNLIPACADCNKGKLDSLASNADEQTLHPYFDDIDAAVWLKATVVQSVPAAARFFVETTALPANMAKRAEQHFSSFKLGRLYTSHAADEIVGISERLTNLLKVGNAIAVKADLLASASSRAKAKKNSWQAALYAALADSDWYCKGGCKCQ
jgi:hypothetical protein